MIEIVLKVLIAYLLGSVSGSLVLGRLKGLDVRNVGSGNAGATNALRAGGWAFALGVLVIDVGKGWLAAAVLPGLNLPGVASSTVSIQSVAILCGFAAILGHCFPLFHGFRGGKGVGTSVGVLLALSPMVSLVVVSVWVVESRMTCVPAPPTVSHMVNTPEASRPRIASPAEQVVPA